MSKQIDPDGPYNHGYDDRVIGHPFDGGPYPEGAGRREYRNGYEAAKRAEKSPL